MGNCLIECISKSTYSDQEIIDLSRVSRAVFYKIKNGTYGLPAKGKVNNSPLFKLSVFFKISIDDILGGYDKKDVEDSIYKELNISPNRLPLESFQMMLPESIEGMCEIVESSPAFVGGEAFLAIKRFEELLCKKELLIVNEPPLIFWDDDDVDRWSRALNLATEEKKMFVQKFRAYRDHFLRLLASGKKHYKVVLNYPSLLTWLRSKTVENARNQIETLKEAINLDHFHLALINVTEASSHRIYPETEVISSHLNLHDNQAIVVSVAIEQVKPDIDQSCYILSMKHPENAKHLIQRDINRVESLYNEACKENASDTLNHSQNIIKIMESIARELH